MWVVVIGGLGALARFEGVYEVAACDVVFRIMVRSRPDNLS